MFTENVAYWSKFISTIKLNFFNINSKTDSQQLLTIKLHLLINRRLKGVNELFETCSII